MNISDYRVPVINEIGKICNFECEKENDKRSCMIRRSLERQSSEPKPTEMFNRVIKIMTRTALEIKMIMTV